MSRAEEVLVGVPLFASLKPKELRKLAGEAHEVTFEAGRHLADDDGFGSTFFVVVDGSVEVLVNGNPVREIGAGEYFGEMAVISRDTRSATVVAKVDTTCLVFSRPVFRPFLANHPEVAWAMLERMVERVREVESRLATQLSGQQ